MLRVLIIVVRVLIVVVRVLIIVVRVLIIVVRVLIIVVRVLIVVVRVLIVVLGVLIVVVRVLILVVRVLGTSPIFSSRLLPAMAARCRFLPPANPGPVWYYEHPNGAIVRPTAAVLTERCREHATARSAGAQVGRARRREDRAW